MATRMLVPWSTGAVSRTTANPFVAMQQELLRTFEDLWGDAAGPAAVWNSPAPRLDLSETENEIHLSMELPGMSEQDVEVELLDDAVKVRGEKKDERVSQEHHVHRTERLFGQFERVVALPKPVERDKVSAHFKNGVLNVVLPKAVPPVTHQKIAVQAG